MKPIIFVALSTFSEFDRTPIEILDQSGFEYSLNPTGRRLIQHEIIKFGRNAYGIIAGVEPYDDYVLDNIPNLRCISRCGVGIDNISIEKAKEKNIEIRNTPEVVIQPVVELTVAMIFDLMRRLSYQTGLMRAKIWQKSAGNLLAGKKLGILGLGRIGKKVSEVMLKLGTEVYGSDLSPDTEWAEIMGVKVVPADQLLRLSDILSIHLSEVEGKPFRLGEKDISLMKKGAFLVNVSRGQFVDEDALYVALKSGRLAGAALDVFPQEPYSGKLCELENVILTPHIATLTKESRVQMESEAASNLVNFFKSQLNGR